MPEVDPRAMLRSGRALINARKANADHPHRLGVELAQRGDFDGAVRAFEVAVAQLPDAPWSFLGLGDALSELRQIEKAKRAYQDALRCTPNSAFALRESIGNGMVRIGEFEAAAQIYRDVLESEPDRESSRLALARVLFNLGESGIPEAAAIVSEVEDPTVDRALVETAIAASPRNPKLYRLMAKTLMAAAAFDQAVDLLELALAHDSQDRVALQLLAEALTAAHLQHNESAPRGAVTDTEFAAAVHAAFVRFDRAVYEEPTGIDLACGRARVADLLDDPRRSAECWGHVVALCPDNALFHRELGDRLALIGEFAAAGIAYDSAVALGYQVF